MKDLPRPPALSFGEWLKGMRLARGITQKELAKACGITNSYVSRLEHGLDRDKHGDPLPPSPAVVEAIARGLEVPPEAARAAAGYSPSPAPYPFGTWLRAARLKSGLSQEELAKLCGVTGAYVSLLEQGEADAEGVVRDIHPSPEVVDAMARALGVPYEEARAAAGYGPPEVFPLAKHEQELMKKFRALPLCTQLDLEVEVDALYQRSLKGEGPAGP